MIRKTASYLIATLITFAAWGQSSSPAVFVANNGNLEGSVTSFTIDGAGALHLVQKVITGSKPSSQDYHPGTNAYAISLSPNGRVLVSTHATSSDTVERLTFLEVNSDATMTIVGVAQTPDSPLDAQWITDRYLAVTLTNVGGSNRVIVYDYDSEAVTITEIDRENTGSFTTALVLHPSGQYLYAQDSTGQTVTAFQIDGAGLLTNIGVTGSGGYYPLGPGITHDGKMLYAGGGISGDGKKIVGFSAAVNGTLSLMAGSPFTSPGASPKQAVSTGDDAYLIVAHGTDATMRSFAIDPATGALTSTGFSFDVGLQGSLGSVETLGNLLFVTDNTTATDGLMGIYSFTVNANGSFTQNGAILSTTGIAPSYMAVWTPTACVACDVNCDGSVNPFDIQAFIDQLGATPPPPCSPCAADTDGNGSVNPFDIQGFIICLGG